MAYTLHCGDCLNILPAIPSQSVDAVITDPPYGTKKTAWDESIDPTIFAECLRVSRGYCAFFYSNTRLWHILGILHGLSVDTWVVPWHKNNAMGFERKFAPVWVPIVIAYRKGVKFFGQDVITCPVVKHDISHPTPKPLTVVRRLIEKTTNPGDTIIDPFMGSGTTGVACAMEGRRFIGIEKESQYFEIARRRIETVQPALMEVSA